jgi:hypothetical protein
MTSTSRIRRLLAAAAATVAVMAVGLPAAQADASVGAMTATLQVNPTPLPGQQFVKVEGVVRMTPTEAQRMIDSRYNLVIRLWGEDGFPDDLPMGPYNPADVHADIWGCGSAPGTMSPTASSTRTGASTRSTPACASSSRTR